MQSKPVIGSLTGSHICKGECRVRWTDLELESEFGAGNRNLGASFCRWSIPGVDGIAYGESVDEEGGGLGLRVSNTERLWDEGESGKQTEKEVLVGEGGQGERCGRPDSGPQKHTPSSTQSGSTLPRVAKGTLQTQLGVRSEEREIILDYLGGPNFTTGVFKNGKGM